jgi:hypothetical protein
MAVTFKFYKDSGLTQPFVPGNDYIGPVTTPPDDSLVLYLGSTDATKKLQATTSPGTNPVQVTIADADIGNDLETTDVTISDSYAGLSTATAGAALDLPATILGGVANKATIYIKVDFAAGGIASDVNVTLNVSGDEYAV